MFRVINADGNELPYGYSLGRKVEGGREWFFGGCDKPWRIKAFTEGERKLHTFSVSNTQNVFNLTIR